jgi:hypothetical protein
LAVILWILWAASRRWEPGLWAPVLISIVALVLDIRLLRRFGNNSLK